MKHARFILSLVLLGALGLTSFDVRAEQADPCAIVGEEIVNLRPPEFDRALRWKRTYGVEGEDKIISLVPLADLGFVAIGMTTPAVKDTVKGTLTTKTPQLYLNRHDKTGKLLWEKRIEIPNLVRVADATVIKDRIMIAADAGKDNATSVHLISVDGLGNKIGDDVITSGNASLSARAIVGDAGGNSVTFAATETGAKKGSVPVSKLFRRTLKGTAVFEREYLADIPSQLQDIQKLPDGTMVAVGRARITRDRMGGWILHVDKKGDIITSQLFPRGRQAQLNRMAALDDGSWIVSGRIIASDTGANSAAWVMRLKAGAEPMWQHYMRGGYNFDGRSIIILPDGRIQILIDGMAITGKENAGRNHARIVTYTPEGRVSDMESFIEGSNANGHDMIRHGEFRILGGRAQTGFSNADKKSDAYNATYDVWLAGLPLPKDVPSICGVTNNSNSLMDLE
jgi:hypothetical protein